ncbi:UDP-N-acetylglucosamine 1-carboxyvinyltransferase [Bittarella massiliensis]|uniref:UDP-N-acetylglucosamine 1-carboxyvinyltransferase n=1 Tax=Bittarella massiliensis (ex Durand et al. 2017) TaxID=1720313 RepID=UPI0013706412|nr:UDP-N-acetylglucosamine 1-carboxyvinyltransferase [Bittarella massiliensis (ex Durand et al. 2017)]MZL79067.1 UDP-N-acetylglucosamine 1-carboxyvinyltransferase [Bittarella massiliensis (ex Durand et al. 2017)]
MEKIVIRGGKPLMGDVNISGAKNAAVAILPGVVLAEGPCIIENVPAISDIATTVAILQSMGATVTPITKNTLQIDPTTINCTDVPHELTKYMRGSYYFIGSILGRYGEARVALPGGCNFGVRPIDQHLKGLEALGAQATINDDVIHVKADRLIGAHVYFDIVSVGATINVMLAAVKAQGVTILENVAKEPHIVDLANFLNSMGADIRGAGTDVIKIHGVEHLGQTEYGIIPDQIEAGTYMVAAAPPRGDVLVSGVIPKHLESITATLQKAGVQVTEYDEAVRVKREGPVCKCNVKTLPHPGFPTDMQPQITALLSVADGTSIITEGVWDNRFAYTEQLRKMGADIQVDGRVAVVSGVPALHAAAIQAVDLRAGAAVVIAALMTEGTSEISDIRHIERGYEEIISKLRDLGADIKKVEE